ncbi:MAG: membrane-associated protease 1 [Clostridiaceae bacterium]|nr:membrane-associated protease 1 [Clostridiaceae bacterium]
MAFKITATSAAQGGYSEGFELDDKIVKSVSFKTDTPDDSNSRTGDVGVIVTIMGIMSQKQETLEETKKVAKWSLEKTTPYLNVVIQHIKSGFMMREYTLTQAFVVDYIEEFQDAQGDGTFTLIIKQQNQYIEDVGVEGGYQV